MERLIEARVIDSRHLELQHPIKIAPGSKVMINIEAGGSVAEESELYQLSAANFEAAYSNEEPDYSLEMIKEKNPDYQA